MSRPDSTEVRTALFVPKARPDIYTVLLIVAFVAIVIACVCLWLDLDGYEWQRSAPRAELVPSGSRSVTTFFA